MKTTITTTITSISFYG